MLLGVWVSHWAAPDGSSAQNFHPQCAAHATRPGPLPWVLVGLQCHVLGASTPGSSAMPYVPSRAARPGLPAGEATERDPHPRMVDGVIPWAVEAPHPWLWWLLGAAKLLSKIPVNSLPERLHCCPHSCPRGGVFRRGSRAETKHTQPMSHLTRMPPKAQGRWLGGLNQTGPAVGQVGWVWNVATAQLLLIHPSAISRVSLGHFVLLGALEMPRARWG